ncbi:hypothetical protein FACS189490_09280 [Clostridia bacterium]|nr:hypothetical protein FACS189490_09280 [Clostridia bacterium]
MISAQFLKRNGAIVGFTVKNHGQSKVCAAVSALTINAANSLEMFADCDLTVEHNENGGFLKVFVPMLSRGEENKAAAVLLNSLELGLNSISETYKGSILVSVREENNHDYNESAIFRA